MDIRFNVRRQECIFADFQVEGEYYWPLSKRRLNGIEKVVQITNPLRIIEGDLVASAIVDLRRTGDGSCATMAWAFSYRPAFFRKRRYSTVPVLCRFSSTKEPNQTNSGCSKHRCLLVWVVVRWSPSRSDLPLKPNGRGN